MKIAVISDTHLGCGGKTDRFGHDEQAFHRFLDALEEAADAVVLLGDVLDTHHGTVPLAFFREVRVVRQVHAGLVDRLLGGRYRFVHGNHDACFRGLPGVAEELLLERDGMRVLMLHGHQFDRLIATSETLCAVGNWAAGMAQRAGMKRALAFLDWFDDFANGMTRDRSELYREKALALAERRGVDLVVLAHTHRPDRAEAGGRGYLNVGCCLQGRFEYGLIDTRERSFEARTWQEQG